MTNLLEISDRISEGIDNSWNVLVVFLDFTVSTFIKTRHQALVYWITERARANEVSESTKGHATLYNRNITSDDDVQKVEYFGSHWSEWIDD